MSKENITFHNLHKGIDCDCLKEAKVDAESRFGRKTNKENLRLSDFKSGYEKGKIIKNKDCEKICGNRGVSLNIINTETRNAAINKFKEFFHLSPGYRPYINIISFKEKAGMIKETPRNNNPYHCDFYKSDNFTLEYVEQIETIPLKDV